MLHIRERERERERGIQPNLILKQVFGDNNMYDVLSFLFFANNKKKVNSFITEGITKSYGNLIYVKNQLPSFFRLMLIELTLCLDREDEEKEGKVARIF